MAKNGVVFQRKDARTPEEHALTLGLVKNKLKAAQIAAYVNSVFGLRRSEAAIAAYSWKHRKERIPADLQAYVTGHVPKAKKFPVPERKPKKAHKKAHKKAVTPVVEMETPTLSRAAQKALEVKLVQHRFRLETPKQTVEVMVAGEGAADLFKQVMASISTNK